MKFTRSRTPARGHPTKYYFVGTPMAGVQSLDPLILGPGLRRGTKG